MGANLSAIAALVASPPRAAMLEALLEGQALTAGQLALIGRVAPSTASEHLAALVTGNLVRVARKGRNRYYELSSKRVATALEAFAEICPPAQVTSLHQATRAEALRNARTCYDHLAGRLGVAVLDALVARQFLVHRSSTIGLTAAGERRFQSVGIDLRRLRAQARPLARLCIDSTERRPHLGGALGAAFTTALFEIGWIRRRGPRRGVMITTSGEMGLRKAFGLPRSWARPTKQDD